MADPKGSRSAVVVLIEPTLVGRIIVVIRTKMMITILRVGLPIPTALQLPLLPPPPPLLVTAIRVKAREDQIRNQTVAQPLVVSNQVELSTQFNLAEPTFLHPPRNLGAMHIQVSGIRQIRFPTLSSLATRMCVV